MGKINQLSKNLFLNFQFIYRNPKIIVRLTMISLLLILLPVFVFPLEMCGSMVFEFSVLLTTLVIFGSMNHEWKRSTLYNNYCSSNYGNGVYYISLFLTTLVVSLFLVNLILLVLFILYKVNLLGGGLVGYILKRHSGGSEISYDFKYMPFDGFYYSIFWMVIISFLMFYVISLITKTQKKQYMFVIVLIMFIFLFSGVFNNYFPGTKYVIGDDGVKYSIQGFEKFLYPKWFFIPSLLFPLYASGQIMNFTLHSTKIYQVLFNGWKQTTPFIKFFDYLNVIQWVPINSITGIDARNWDIVLIMPAIWTVSLILMSLFISSIKK